MSLQTSLRTHTCGELRASNENATVMLSGWVATRRDHGGVIFIDLRDRHGITQIVFNEAVSKECFALAGKLRREDVITIKGVVKQRGKDLINPKIPTGEVEVFVDFLNIINRSETPPFEISDDAIASDDVRLEYRYLDLRRGKMQRHLKLRNDVTSIVRQYFNSIGFLEIETPLLIKSTPEGARDYVVPSRVNKGQFYALPQSPQLYKQILMISGMDRYFQIAKCLRDEDLRADRQPEHTQIDLEMSFVSQEDVRNAVAGLYVQIFEKALGYKVKTPFVTLTYQESMDKYGCDKPDLRFDLPLTDVTSIVTQSDFSVFKTVAANGGIVKCINPLVDISRNDIDKYIDFCQKNGAKGMAWMRVTAAGLESNIAKYFTPEVQQKLIAAVGAKPGSVLMFIADRPKQCNDIICKLRLKLGEDLKLIDNNAFALCWIIDFPMFEYNEDEKRWDAMHNPFCTPHYDDLADLENNLATARAQQYDLVLNGVELGSGAIRISNPDLQKRVFKLIGITETQAEEKFGFLLKAYKYGGPVHGGMGLGLDRTVALMVGTNDIREVIAFPKNKAAQCPMDNCPSPIDDKQLKELSIKIDGPVVQR